MYTREIGRGGHAASHGTGFNGARVCTPGKFPSDLGRHLETAVASMGPGFVHPGNDRTTRPRRCRPYGFNGARVCTPGKSVAPATATHRKHASMGPGFVHPGNYSGSRTGSLRSRLQWGPGLYTREIGGTRRPFTHLGWLQWGPGLYTREINHPTTLVRVTHPLQWGPGLYTREMRPKRARKALSRRCFNGARVCTPGKWDLLPRCRCRCTGFNGARVCTPGKSGIVL